MKPEISTKGTPLAVITYNSTTETRGYEFTETLSNVLF